MQLLLNYCFVFQSGNRTHFVTCSQHFNAIADELDTEPDDIMETVIEKFIITTSKIDDGAKLKFD